MIRSFAHTLLLSVLTLAGNTWASDADLAPIAPIIVQTGKCKKPQYPTIAVQDGKEGISVLGVLVRADGSPADQAVFLSSGHAELDRIVLTMLSNCTFKPGRVGGQPAAMWYALEYKWSIEGGDVQERLLGQAAMRASKGNPDGRLQLSYLYMGAGDHARALVLTRSAAELGQPMAQFSLGRGYERGDGVEKDIPTALQWYRKAAESGNGLAIDRLRLGSLPAWHSATAKADK